MVESASPKHGEKASYYSAVCLETGEVEWMGLEGKSNSETSVVFLEQLRKRHDGKLKVTLRPIMVRRCGNTCGRLSWI